MNPRNAQVNFSKGELAPALYGRFDVDAWQGAVKEALNVTILKYGGLTKRLGLRLVGEVLDVTPNQRLIPFEFSLDQTYALEFGQGYAAPMALGGRVLQEELAITNITSASNAAVSIAFHGYAVGDVIFLQGIAGEMGRFLNGRQWRVLSVPDANTFTINANTTGLTFTSAEGGITRSAPPTPDPVVPVPPVPPPPPLPPVTPPYDGRPLLPGEDIP